MDIPKDAMESPKGAMECVSRALGVPDSPSPLGEGDAEDSNKEAKEDSTEGEYAQGGGGEGGGKEPAAKLAPDSAPPKGALALRLHRLLQLGALDLWHQHKQPLEHQCLRPAGFLGLPWPLRLPLEPRHQPLAQLQLPQPAVGYSDRLQLPLRLPSEPHHQPQPLERHQHLRPADFLDLLPLLEKIRTTIWN